MQIISQDALKEADLSVVMDGLNVLGHVPWIINKKVLSAAERCWDEGIVLGDIPSRVDHELPPVPIRPEGNNVDYKEAQGEFRAYREALQKYRRVHQKNMVSIMAHRLCFSILYHAYISQSLLIFCLGLAFSSVFSLVKA